MTQSPTPQSMRPFAVIWIGQLVSLIGSGLTSFALGVLIYERTGSATQFAINVVVYYLPAVLLAPLAGLAADQLSRRRVMLIADSLAGVATLAMLALYSVDALAVWHIYVVTALISAANTFHGIAYVSSISMLVPDAQLGRASGMTQAAESFSMLLAPALAGFLYVSIGMEFIFLLDLLTFLFAIITLTLTRIPQPPLVSGSPTESFWNRLSFGWRYLRDQRGLLYLVMVLAACNFAYNISAPLIGPMILDQGNPQVWGFVSSMMGVGMIGGTMIMSAWGGFRRRIYGVSLADIVCGVFIVLMGIRPSIPLIAIGALGSGLTGPIGNGSSRALFQSRVPRDLQGRVFAAIRMTAHSIIPLATALSGVLADRVFIPLLMPDGALANTLIGQIVGVGAGRGIGLLLVISGIAYSLIASISLIHPRIRNIEGES